MKKIYLLFLICSGGLFVSAQREIGTPHAVKQLPKANSPFGNKIEASCDDTVYYPIPGNWNLTYYSILAGGYISGINTYGDKEKANYFDLSAQDYTYIKGMSVDFAVAKTGNPANLPKNLNFKVYADNAGQPGAQIGSSFSIPLASIVTDVNDSVLTYITFPAAIALPASKKFYVSVDLSNFSLANDSIALAETSYQDLAPGTGIAWEKWSDNTWHNFNTTWGSDIALVILPYVSTAAGACSVLPVNLVSFKAERNDKNVILTWNVANEINMKGYEIEKADNNNNYKTVTFLPAHNDPRNLFYSYTDLHPFSSAAPVLYRLKQIDIDGKIKYSNIVSVKNPPNINSVTVLENPFKNSVHIQLNLANPSHVAMNVYDMRGSLICSEKPAFYTNLVNSIELQSTSILKSGVYVLRIIAGDEQFNYKIIKQ